jgi:hypothetical protein
VERYQVTLLISTIYCEYVPSSAITNIPFRQLSLLLAFAFCLEKPAFTPLAFSMTYCPNKVYPSSSGWRGIVEVPETEHRRLLYLALENVTCNFYFL